MASLAATSEPRRPGFFEADGRSLAELPRGPQGPVAWLKRRTAWKSAANADFRPAPGKLVEALPSLAAVALRSSRLACSSRLATTRSRYGSKRIDVLALLGLLAGVVVGCGDSFPPVGRGASALEALCDAEIIGVGARQVELDYLPHVVACEIGEAPSQALRAQAVAARSYLYYEMGRRGEIVDGVRGQVYTCSNKPSARHFEAVEDTRGEVLTYGGVQVAAFYVAGAEPSGADCRAVASDPDRFDTERFVTYNAGLRGEALHQTPLGFLDPSNLANRGCMSQHGAMCLASEAWPYPDILRFYYGEDIELRVAGGECGADEDFTCWIDPRAETLLLADGPCFQHDCLGRPGFERVPVGGAAGVHYRLVPDAETIGCEGRWSIGMRESGTFLVEAYVPEASGGASRVDYELRHAGRFSAATADQSVGGQWVPLGAFAFTAGRGQWVRLQVEPEHLTGGMISFDAMRLTRVLGDAEGDPGDEGDAGDEGAEDGAPAVRQASIGGGCASSGQTQAPWAIGAFVLGTWLGVSGRWRSRAGLNRP